MSDFDGIGKRETDAVFIGTGHDVVIALDLKAVTQFLRTGCAVVGGKGQTFLQLGTDVVQRALYGVDRFSLRTVGFGYHQIRYFNRAGSRIDGCAQCGCQRSELADVDGVGIVHTGSDFGCFLTAVRQTFGRQFDRVCHCTDGHAVCRNGGFAACCIDEFRRGQTFQLFRQFDVECAIGVV